MKYSQYLSIGKQFRNSVNIEYDLECIEKISEYIPTEDICETLDFYFDAILLNSPIKSTLLEGPYGKGKSYLVLSLMQMLYFDESAKPIKDFLEKLKVVDVKTYKKYKEIKNKGYRFLPVIINSNYANLSQALNIALKDALKRANHSELFPDTAFKSALSIIENWKNDTELYKNIVNKCVEKYKLSLKDIEKGLRNFDYIKFEEFQNLYNCVINGQEFNAFTNDDVVKNYRDIIHKLGNYGYKGLFIVFDEFSKFIESNNNNMSSDLKILQDLAEVANRSETNEQMFLCCITHKSFDSYYRNKKDNEVNSFKTVEGRFKEIRFNRSLNQNYQIISFAINKNSEFKKEINKVLKIKKDFYDEIFKYPIFKDIDDELLSKGCFPLNPLTTYCLINISEKIAQNERTLFTFISDDDPYSLSTFIKKNGTRLLNVDNIYDYFINVIERSFDDEIKKIGYKTNSCLSKIDNELEKKIVKTIAVIKIINNDNLCASNSILHSCIDENETDVNIALSNLVDRKLLKKSFSTGNYDFALANSKVIDDYVDDYLARNANKSISNILNGIFRYSFVLPHKYNTVHKITRFYREKYITDVEFMNVTTFDGYYNADFSDGYIFNVIRLNNISQKKLKEHYFTIKNNDAVVVKIPKDKISEDIKFEIFRIDALKSLIIDNKIDEIVKEEAKLILNDENNELAYILSGLYSTNDNSRISKYDDKDFNSLLSLIMENYFADTPTVNNEMINKEKGISVQYTKPRNKIVDLILKKEVDVFNGTLLEYSQTSPENTVFNSIKNCPDIEKRKIINAIKKVLSKKGGEKIDSIKLINMLRSSPYGIRAGVMPLFISIAISELDDNVIMYFSEKEIDLDAENISKMISHPSNYFFAIVEGTREKTAYMTNMLKKLSLKTTYNFRNDAKQIVSHISKLFMMQPKIIRIQKEENNFLDLDDKFIKLKKIFTKYDLNEYDVLFNEMPSIFDNDFKKTIKYVFQYLNKEPEIVIDNFTEKLIKTIKSLFNANKNSSLFNSINDWIIKNKVNEKLLEKDEKIFVDLFDSANYDDSLLVNEISKIITGVSITDWEQDNIEKIIVFINNLKANIKNKKIVSDVFDKKTIKINKDFKISTMGELLKNNIDESIDEFGESISNEEKIQILLSIVDKMIK